jgi:hypothetical protein
MKDRRSLIRYSQALVGQTGHGLQDQHLEHAHGIERRTAALGSIGTGNRCFEVEPKDLEIDDGVDAFQIVAFGGQFLQTLVNGEEPWHLSRPICAPLQI